MKKFLDKKKNKEKISVLTAYDFPFARILDQAGVDMILVGDSLGMVCLGQKDTVSVTMREMLHHTKAVTRGAQKALVIADLPFGAYTSPEQTLRNALRLVKEGGANAVKLEGLKGLQKSIQGLVRAGVPVMGHLGMTPQTAVQLGGYRVQGREKKQAEKILDEAKQLDKLGVFAIVLECVPAPLAKKITKSVSCPTIGIGAGNATDGQVLVLHDLLGIESSVRPRFVRRYASLEKTISRATKKYIQDVLSGDFPSKKESF